MKYRNKDGAMLDYKHSFAERDFAELAAFLDSHAEVVPLRELVEDAGRTDIVALRHDVDHNLWHALKFARWEAEHGYRSSYFVLHTAWYYEDKPRLYEQMRAIVALGHEVGIHHDAVAAAYRQGDDLDGSALPAGTCERAAQLLRYEIDLLRAEGFEIVGAANHGTPLFKKLGIHNADLWAAGYAPADFGLTYEAYQLHRGSHYLSDNHGSWGKPLEAVEGKVTMMLAHPCHWNVDALQRVAA